MRLINPGEELVGVYGVRGRARWFTSLGFIVCKKVFPHVVSGIDELASQTAYSQEEGSMC